ncbi:hypothetical protein [Streptomyces sp. NRRL S-350]|uniref:hypothetical protein n=1 Tax=Streptomyces sp. NRRL S-350 TaxID=1463902 RepID=UPI0004C166C1|nr:hypothetical protein [Streptomyces sp. NRRL S-350]
MARPPIDIDVAAVLRTVDQADALAARALAGGELAGLELDALYALYEELTGHLLLLLAGTEERYRHLVPRTRMRVVVSDALRLGGGLVAAPLRLGVLDIVAMAPICRLLLVLHQGKDAFARYAGAHPLVWATQEAEDGQDEVPAPASER